MSSCFYPDPNTNLALRAVFEKYRGKSVPKDVFERAIKKAQGGDVVAYAEGRYEAYGPAGSYLIIDTLTDNPNRALTLVRTEIIRKGGHLGSVIYNFSQKGVLAFKGNNRDEVEEALILGDVDVSEVEQDEDLIVCYVAPESFAHAKEVLAELGITEYEEAEVQMLANDTVEMPDEESR